MRPPHWYPPIELSPLEQTIVARIRRAKLFTQKGLDRRLVERTVELAKQRGLIQVSKLPST